MATDVSNEESVQTVDESTLIALCKNQLVSLLTF